MRRNTAPPRLLGQKCCPRAHTRHRGGSGPRGPAFTPRSRPAQIAPAPGWAWRRGVQTWWVRLWEGRRGAEWVGNAAGTRRRQFLWPRCTAAGRRDRHVFFQRSFRRCIRCEPAPVMSYRAPGPRWGEEASKSPPPPPPPEAPLLLGGNPRLTRRACPHVARRDNPRQSAAEKPPTWFFQHPASLPSLMCSAHPSIPLTAAASEHRRR